MKQKLNSIDWIVVIGIISSLLSIFVFITGWNNVKEIWEASLSTNTPLATKKAVVQNFTPQLALVNTIPWTPTPAVTKTPRAISTSITTPQPPQQIFFSNPNTSISTYNDLELSGKSKVEVRISALTIPEQFKFCVSIGEATKDIAGYWSASQFTVMQDLQQEGIELIKDPGEYAIWLIPNMHNFCVGSPESVYKGNYGIEGRIEGAKTQLIPISLKSNIRTEVIIYFSVLEIGILSPEGDARTGYYVGVYTQNLDIAGKRIQEDQVTWVYTDIRGIATVLVPAGTYMLELGQSDRYPIFDISVNVNEKQSLRFVH